MTSSEKLALHCIREFMKVALGPDPAGHGLSLSDVAAATRFKRTLDELRRAH